MVKTDFASDRPPVLRKIELSSSTMLDLEELAKIPNLFLSKDPISDTIKEILTKYDQVPHRCCFKDCVVLKYKQQG
jgi:hypothetical protein